MGKNINPIREGENCMRHHLKTAFVLGLAALPAGPAVAQEPPASDEIVVTGTRVSTLDLPRLLKAQAAFEAGRAKYAPTSALYFQLRPAAGVAVEGMTLALVKGDQDMIVPIDAENRFTLPRLPAGRWELVHNRGAGRIAVRALVISAGTSEADRPLGDLRLQCRAGWELAKAKFSFIERGGFSAMGGCNSGKFAFYFRTPRAIQSATLTSGAATSDLPVMADRSAYRAPLGDKALPNDARIRVRYN